MTRCVPTAGGPGARVLPRRLDPGRAARVLFKHILTRDVAYESLPPKRSRRPRTEPSLAGWSGPPVSASASSRSSWRITCATAVAAARDAGDEPDPRIEPQRCGGWCARLATPVVGWRCPRRNAWPSRRSSSRRDDAERIDALEALAETAFTASLGDLGWRSFREAALLARLIPRRRGASGVPRRASL